MIGIENKIYSFEGDNQTISYEKGLRSDYERCKIYPIFLTPAGQAPRSKEFQAVSYRDLLKALREIRYSVLNDMHKTVIWEDFLSHLEEYIVMTNGKFEISDKTHLYIEHAKMIEGLRKSYLDDAQKTYDFVTGSIKNSLVGDWVFNFQSRYGFQEIQRESWRLGKFYLFFQYFFSRDSILTADRFSMMVGPYPKNAESRAFLDWLKTHRPEIADICAEREMDCYPLKVIGSSSSLIAYKEYPQVVDPQNLENFHKQFLNALEEFKVFIPIIDDAVQGYLRFTNAGEK